MRQMEYILYQIAVSQCLRINSWLSSIHSLILVSYQRLTPCSRSSQTLYCTKNQSLSSQLYDLLAEISGFVSSFRPCMIKAGIFRKLLSFVDGRSDPLRAITPAGASSAEQVQSRAIDAPCPIPPTQMRCWEGILPCLAYFQRVIYSLKHFCTQLLLLLTLERSVSLSNQPGEGVRVGERSLLGAARRRMRQPRQSGDSR